MPLNVAFIPYIQFLRWNGSSIFTIFLNVNIDKLRMVNKKLSLDRKLLIDVNDNCGYFGNLVNEELEKL